MAFGARRCRVTNYRSFDTREGDLGTTCRGRQMLEQLVVDVLGKNALDSGL